jgi:hypothetical protein
MTDLSTDVLSPGLPDVTMRAPGRKPLPRPWRATTPGGWVPSDDELLERTLAFSGTYASDDGHVTIGRSPSSFEYSGARFTGYCTVCARAGLIPPTGKPLSDAPAAVEFVAAHNHGDVA